MDGQDHVNIEAVLTRGPVGGQLLALAIPMTWGMFAIVAFNLADTYFVGQLGTLPLAAISFTFPVVMTVGSIAIGLGVGAASVISRAIGSGDKRMVQRLTTDSLTLALLCVGIFILIGMTTIDPLFRAMGATDEVLPMVREYMQVWYFGMIFLVVPMVGNNAVRASGDTIYPSLIMTVSAAINVCLDPILIFGLCGLPRMGLRGAAVATVISRALSMIAALMVLHYRKKMLSLTWPGLHEVIHSWKKVLHVGIPAAGMFTIIPVSAGVITAMMASFGPEAVAAFGVATKIESFCFIVLFALSTSIAPFIGQNFGAGHHDRMDHGLKMVFIFSLCWGAAIAVVLAIWGERFSSLFDTNPAVIKVATTYLLIVPASYGFHGVTLMASSAFNALGKPLPAIILTFVRVMVLYIPLAWLGKHFLHTTSSIFVAACIANVSVGIWAWLWNRRVCRQLGQADKMTES